MAYAQIADFKEKTSRIVFGPDLAVLGPHEEFNVLSLSAGKPKKENVLKVWYGMVWYGMVWYRTPCFGLQGYTYIQTYIHS